jgi:phosphotransferase system IIB component
VGAEADQVAGEMRIALRSAGATTAASGAAAAAPTANAAASTAPTAPAAAPIPISTLAALLAALGGRTNIRTIETASTRLRINIVDPKAVNESAITALGLRGIANAAPNWLHVIVGPQAAPAGATLRQLL